ncbi:unnamed protein product [Boreogadus saida]
MSFLRRVAGVSLRDRVVPHPPGTMSYGSIDEGSFGPRNPFGGPSSQGYRPVGKDGTFMHSHSVTASSPAPSLSCSRLPHRPSGAAVTLIPRC